MNSLSRFLIPILALATTAAADPPSAAVARAVQQEPIRVVATLPVYAEVAQEVGGSAVEASAIADPSEDAHFVRPKPSYALRIRQADVFITTGLDLELWVPALLDKAGNPAVAEGGRGYVTTYPGIELLDVPAAADRSEGDIHLFGNPHIFTDPLNMVIAARNIATGLKNVASERAAEFDRNLARFTDRIHRALYGERLVEMLGGETLELLDRQGRLMPFLRDTEFEGAPLVRLLGGWHAQAEPIRGQRVICYHKNWAYFEDRFGVTCAAFVEAKPGIPPTPGHVRQLIDMMRNEGLDVLLATSYEDRSTVEAVTRRAGAASVVVPMQPGPRGVDSYFELVGTWIDALADALAD